MRSAALSKKISKKGQENLVKSSKKGSIELSEAELKQVAGGLKSSGGDAIKIKLTDF